MPNNRNLQSVTEELRLSKEKLGREAYFRVQAEILEETTEKALEDFKDMSHFGKEIRSSLMAIIKAQSTLSRLGLKQNEKKLDVLEKDIGHLSEISSSESKALLDVLKNVRSSYQEQTKGFKKVVSSVKEGFKNSAKDVSDSIMDKTDIASLIIGVVGRNPMMGLAAKVGFDFLKKRSARKTAERETREEKKENETYKLRLQEKDLADSVASQIRMEQKKEKELAKLGKFIEENADAKVEFDASGLSLKDFAAKKKAEQNEIDEAKERKSLAASYGLKPSTEPKLKVEKEEKDGKVVKKVKQQANAPSSLEKDIKIIKDDIVSIFASIIGNSSNLVQNRAPLSASKASPIVDPFTGETTGSYLPFGSRGISQENNENIAAVKPFPRDAKGRFLPRGGKGSESAVPASSKNVENTNDSTVWLSLIGETLENLSSTTDAGYELLGEKLEIIQVSSEKNKNTSLEIRNLVQTTNELLGAIKEDFATEDFAETEKRREAEMAKNKLFSKVTGESGKNSRFSEIKESFSQKLTNLMAFKGTFDTLLGSLKSFLGLFVRGGMLFTFFSSIASGFSSLLTSLTPVLAALASPLAILAGAIGGAAVGKKLFDNGFADEGTVSGRLLGGTGRLATKGIKKRGDIAEQSKVGEDLYSSDSSETLRNNSAYRKSTVSGVYIPDALNKISTKMLNGNDEEASSIYNSFPEDVQKAIDERAKGLRKKGIEVILPGNRNLTPNNIRNEMNDDLGVGNQIRIKPNENERIKKIQMLQEENQILKLDKTMNKKREIPIVSAPTNILNANQSNHYTLRSVPRNSESTFQRVQDSRFVSP